MRLKPVVSVVGLAALAACQGGSDIEELKKGQKDILAKLDGLDKAGKQGKFWEMHDIVFKNNRELGYDKLKEYAGQIGLDVARWEKDFNAPEVQQQIEKDMADGRAADVQGTPTFFIAGKRISNRSVEGFKQMIDEALKTQG